MKKIVLAVEIILIVACIALNCCVLFINPAVFDGGSAANTEMMPEGDFEALQETTTEGDLEALQETTSKNLSEQAAPADLNLALTNAQKNGWIIKALAVVMIVMSLLVGYYVLFGYKVPHGDMLRWVMFAFAFCIALRDSIQFLGRGEFQVLPFLAMFIAYIAGRLNKIRKNTTLLTIISIVLGGMTVYKVIDGNFAIYSYYISLCIMWAVLVTAYVGRYKEHKEAGLMDASAEVSRGRVP